LDNYIQTPQKEEQVVRNWKQEKPRRQISHHRGIQESSEHIGNTALPSCIHEDKHKRGACRGTIQDAMETFPAADRNQSSMRIL